MTLKKETIFFFFCLWEWFFAQNYKLDLIYEVMLISEETKVARPKCTQLKLDLLAQLQIRGFRNCKLEDVKQSDKHNDNAETKNPNNLHCLMIIQVSNKDPINSEINHKKILGHRNITVFTRIQQPMLQIVHNSYIFLIENIR